MIKRDPQEIKNKIISILRIKGPLLPVPLSKDLEMETWITSAFLSELANEKKIKISKLFSRVMTMN